MAEPALELAPELGPEVEVAARALPRIGAVAILVVCLGIILAVDAIVRAFFGTLKGAVGWIPYLGDVVQTPIKAIEHKVVSFLSGLEADIDSALAHNIHMTARLLDRLWHDLEFMAANIVLLGALGTAAFFHYVVHRVERWVHGLIRKVEAEIHHLEHSLHGATVVIRKTITHVIMPGIRAATYAVPRYVHRELLRIRRDAQHAEKVATHALRAARKAEGKFASKPFALAVSAALATLGLDWLRCKSNPFHKNKHACNLWGDLAGLLAGAAAFGLAVDFRDIVKAAVAIEGDVAGALGALVTLDNAAIKDAAQAVADAANSIAT